MRIADIKILRRVALAALKRLDWDITIRNPWAPERAVTLNIYSHKGYWWQGKRRERETMELFARIVRPGQTVIEIGGHIGYISQYLASLVGSDGKVIVFEPGPNNIPYLKKNAGGAENVVLEMAAVADRVGEVTLYVESVTGQNNSIVKDYDMFLENQASAFSTAPVRSVTVPCVTLDSYLESRPYQPNFIKIDAEGAEASILSGMQNVLRRHRPILMVELTRDADKSVQILRNLSYRLDTMRPDALSKSRPGNVFAFPDELPAIPFSAQQELERAGAK